MAQISSAANETTNKASRISTLGALGAVALLTACAKDQLQAPPPRYAQAILGVDPTATKEGQKDQLLGFDDHYEADIHGADVHSYFRNDGTPYYVQAGPNTVEGIYKLLVGGGSLAGGLGYLGVGAGTIMNGIASLRESNQPNTPQTVISLNNDNSSQSTSNATTNAQLTSILKSNPQLNALLNNDPSTLNYLNNSPKTVTNLSNYLNQNQNYSPTNVVKALQMAAQNQNNDQQNSAPPPPPQKSGWYGSEVLPSDIKDPSVKNGTGQVVGYMVFPERSGRTSRTVSALTAKVA